MKRLIDIIKAAIERLRFEIDVMGAEKIYIKDYLEKEQSLISKKYEQ